MRKFFLFFLAASAIQLNSENNSYGVKGYINTPSAFSSEEGSFSISLIRNSPERKIIISASPFNWLDANFFYVDIVGKEYGSGYKQSYKDKGFSLKITPGEMLGHKIAIGFNDLAGTNYFQSEYFALSNNFSNFEYTFGIGWGRYSEGINFDNPLRRLDPSFAKRNPLKDKGGNIDFNDFFSGKKASLFLGARYRVNKSINIIAEYDPTKIDNSIPFKELETRFNLGLSYRFNNYVLKTYVNRGSSFGINFSYEENFRNFGEKKNKTYTLKNFKDLQDALAQENIGLKDIGENNDTVLINVRQNTYFSHDKASSKTLSVASQLKYIQEFDEVIISQYIHGMKVQTDSFSSFYNKKTTSENSKLIYEVIDNYPYISNNIRPVIRNFFAAREGFYFGGLLIENDNEIVINENFFIVSNIKYSIYDNFDQLFIPPVDAYPNQVRSDVKKYYNNLDNSISIGPLEANYYKQIGKHNFFRLSAGIFEEMFGGLGLEYVYSPENSIISFGAEIFHVKKRDYNMRLNFLDYENTLTRGSIQLIEPKTEIKINLSYGEYLAGDIGYTLAASRIFKSGVEYGAFFTRTNVPKQLFGEGSFDKGIFIRIPIKRLFSKNKQLVNFVWRPLSKDPGALLIKSNNLIDEIGRYRFH